jgi:hypothetical protein
MFIVVYAKNGQAVHQRRSGTPSRTRYGEGGQVPDCWINACIGRPNCQGVLARKCDIWAISQSLYILKY